MQFNETIDVTKTLDWIGLVTYCRIKVVTRSSPRRSPIQAEFESKGTGHNEQSLF